LVKILAKYAPETRTQKADRLRSAAKEVAKDNKNKKGEKPVTLKFGLNHVTYLIEQKRAKLVLIASDVDPIETVVFLPTLCKSMDIPYAIVNNKSRLGQLVHKKTATVVALTDFKENQAELNNIARVCKEQFNNGHVTFKSKNILT
jgi:large subunit ribosomal protein L7Ae